MAEKYKVELELPGNENKSSSPSGKQKFLLTQYLSKVTKEDIYKIGKIIGHTPRDIDNIKNVSEDEKEKFCHLVGFEPYEFERLCSIL